MSAGIEERIAERRRALTPQEARAADTLLEHLDDLASYRAAELADLAGVSKATMSRLFRTLGFAGFDDVRDHLRELRALRTTGVPVRAEGPVDLAAHAAGEAAVVLDVLRTAPVGPAVDVLARAGRVLVVGWRTSHPVALHLRQQLAQARPDVRLAPVPGQVVGEDLADLGPGDAVLAVGFRRRPTGFAAFLAAAAATGADVVLLADPSARPIARHAGVFLEGPIETALAFDSYAAAMSLVGVLADGVHAATGRVGRERVAAISRSYRLLGEVE